MEHKTLADFQRDVAIKHGLGKSLVTGHKASYFNEATELYVADRIASLEAEVRETKDSAILQGNIATDRLNEFYNRNLELQAEVERLKTVSEKMAGILRYLGSDISDMRMEEKDTKREDDLSGFLMDIDDALAQYERYKS